MEFTRNNYITIQGFMITDLKLSGNELICYALMYGFTQDGETLFNGTLNYVASALNVTKQNAKSIIGRLVEKGLVQKNDYYVGGVKFCNYTTNRHSVTETATGVIETATGVTETATGNNTIYNNNYNNIEKIEGKPSIKKDNDKSRISLFCNSDTAQLVQDGDYSRYEALFSEEFADIDLVYYFHVVSDWSDQTNKKRTDRGWRATIRQFIRKDIERGQLHKKPQQNEADLFMQQAIEYLNM